MKLWGTQATTDTCHKKPNMVDTLLALEALEKKILGLPHSEFQMGAGLGEGVLGEGLLVPIFRFDSSTTLRPLLPGRFELLGCRF